MAEGFARRHGGQMVEAHSAGSRPSGTVNPTAIKAMAEKGIDISGHQSKGLTDLPDCEWDWVVTMGCGDSCPHISAKNRADWELPDPRAMAYEEFLQVCDEVESRVIALLRTCGALVDLE